MKKECKLIIFDLDGTLVPTMHGFANIAGEVIAKHFGWSQQAARSAYLETSGAPFFHQLEILFSCDPRNGNAAKDFENQKATYFSTIHMNPRVRQALITLRNQRFSLAVSSNNFAHLVETMLEKEAPNVFHEVCGYRNGFAKGPDHFRWLQKRFSVRADQCLFVGDSLSDHSKAREAGMDFVGITGTFTRERFAAIDARVITANSVTELPALVRSSFSQTQEAATAA